MNDDNYRFLVRYLKDRIENDDYIDRDELKRILTALGFVIREKEKENNE